jgi:hypothetical protein
MQAPPPPAPELNAGERRAIAEAAQRYVNARVFRDMARVIREWKDEDLSRDRAARLLLWLVVAALVAGTVLTGVLAVHR